MSRFPCSNETPINVQQASPEGVEQERKKQQREGAQARNLARDLGRPGACRVYPGPDPKGQGGLPLCELRCFSRSSLWPYVPPVGRANAAVCTAA